ncbi:MAG TPA: hypothetical protein VFZ67_11760 [Nitrososphaera sp.]
MQSRKSLKGDLEKVGGIVEIKKILSSKKRKAEEHYDEKHLL